MIVGLPIDAKENTVHDDHKGPPQKDLGCLDFIDCLVVDRMQCYMRIVIL